jgi:antimicrobial peptide system SdpB family protein
MFETLENFFIGRTFSTPILGLSRSILCLALILTLITNSPSEIFETASPLEGLTQPPFDITNFFMITREIHPFAGHALAILILAVVAYGIYPRWTGILHFWVANSFMRSVILMEGGDQVHAILAMFLLPITLADPRRSHWDKIKSTKNPYLQIVATSAWILICVQMSVIYLQAASSKLGVPEWLDGSAVYYWATHPDFGLSETLMVVFGSLISLPWISFVLTWGALIIEFLLFAGILASTRVKKILLILGVFFHICIWIVHGLFSFSLVMIAGLILYLGPVYAMSDIEKSKNS